MWFGATDDTKPYKFRWFGAIDVTKPCMIDLFGFIGGPKPMNSAVLVHWAIYKLVLMAPQGPYMETS